MDGITAEERARASAFVMRFMLERLWNEYLSTWPEPQEEAAAIERDMLEQLEDIMSDTSGRDAEVTQHVAVTMLEGMWRTIRATLAEDAKPLDIRLPGGRRGTEAPKPDGEPEGPDR